MIGSAPYPSHHTNMTKLNPDNEMVDLIRRGLKKTGGYCPCELEKTEDNKCPCKVFRTDRICRCGLYVDD